MMGAFLESRLAILSMNRLLLFYDFCRKIETDNKRAFVFAIVLKASIRRAVHAFVARHVGGMLSPTPCFLFPSATFSGPPPMSSDEHGQGHAHTASHPG